MNNSLVLLTELNNKFSCSFNVIDYNIKYNFEKVHKIQQCESVSSGDDDKNSI